MYPQGYFHQHITPEGWQEAHYEPFNRLDSPITQALDPSGHPCCVEVEMDQRMVKVLVWQIRVGRVSLYLMDTDVPENVPRDRDLSARLYGGDQEMRLRQEILLGVGGVRVLRALGLAPKVWHANEGHSAFLTLELYRESIQAGLSHDEAIERIRQCSVFTTHTPVPAGHDVFPFHVMAQYFQPYWEQVGLTRETFLQLGQHPDVPDAGFNMTALAMRMSSHINGVSREHGRVSRHMWRNLWPDIPEERTPIRSITNGIHIPTWIAPEMNQLFSKYLGPEWVRHSDNSAVWHRVTEIPDGELWAVRQMQKRKLIGFIRERARAGWMQQRLDAIQVLAGGTLLDPGSSHDRFRPSLRDLQTGAADFKFSDPSSATAPRSLAAGPNYFCRKGPSCRRARSAVYSRRVQFLQESWYGRTYSLPGRL
jgi:alpha-glucan phosphorylases